MQESHNHAPSSAARKSPNGAPRRKKLRSSVNVTKDGPKQILQPISNTRGWIRYVEPFEMSLEGRDSRRMI